MTINPVQFSRFDLPLNKVLSRLGYASGKTNMDAKTQEIIGEEIEAAKKLFSPKQVIASDAIKLSGRKILLGPSLIIESPDIVKLLQGCSVAFGFAVTIGPALEARRDMYLKDKETTRALVLDAAGSVAVEELARITNNEVAADITKNGYGFTRRFSPGYGDWALSGQKEFLSWLGAEQIGIKLNDNFQMIPEKSVSAILGQKHG